ncbi:MAG: response regulator [Thermodesulfovibrio sp.]|jgi:CheY-like chemotaxis protein|uniref:response regulator n=1 Tax=unclassified Thermodesulfovibrio TaxID=2645936 RepID=UPI00083AAE51|nr:MULTISPECIES: response regulator [unclassified Thermodesulfovibrio]MDI1472144.1 response regulator [Thermodesulfovibrio sp. 1176]MDI6715237.1 response regulator [Thermodesulfovibrio sp.]ODA45106.1 two-component response regulator [Thermodesulfovibrio sp. N1]
MKILIVDDEAIIRELILQVIDEIEDMEIQTFEAADGLEALELIKKEKPDIVFLDIMMPKLNGFEICRIFKAEPPTWDMNIIMLTAKGQEIDRQTAKELGVKWYITKPFKIDDIIKLLREIA